MKYTLPQIKKAVIGAVGFGVTVVSAALAVGDVIPVGALPYVNVFMLVAFSYGIFAAKNDPTSQVGYDGGRSGPTV